MAMDNLILQIYSQAAASHVDIITRQKLLVENLDRIFADRGDVETWEYHGESSNLKESVITSVADFDRMCMEAHSLGGRSFFITQGHSWSRLQVTAELMLHIVSFCQITPLMLDFLHCFGAKVTGEDNPYYGTFHASFSGTAEETSVPTKPHYDFCCHLRRFEKHGNSKLKDPWSLRQMTACQRFDIVNQTSTWIFIKPMEHFQKNFRILLSGDQRNNPMAPHLLCLTMASENWRWYVDFLRRRLGEFVEKATFASFDASKLNYDISLVDSQRLSTLGSKVTVAIAVLEQNLAIGRGMKRHCQRLWRINGLNLDHGLQETTESDIEMQLTHLDLHKTSCELLLQRIQGTCSMLLKINDLRNDMIMKDYSKITTELVSMANAQNKSLHAIAHGTKLDSRMMKILTVIAIAFVPPSLIASIFSSDLIKTSDRDVAGNSFRVSKDIWIFVLSSSAISILTVLSALLWAQRTI